MSGTQLKRADRQSELPLERQAMLSEMTLSDGTTLFYRAWKPAADTRRAVVIFHRGHEHSGRLAELVEALKLPDTWVFAWDARGHGRSPGSRGDAPSFTTLVRDVDEFVGFISREYGIRLEDTVVVAHSLASVYVASWVHDFGPRIRGLVLATPAFAVKLYVPFAECLLRLLAAVKPGSTIRSYVTPSLLTSDAEQARRYESDPLVSREISVKVLIGLLEGGRRIVDLAPSIRVPTLVLTAGRDWVVRRAPQEEFYRRLGSPVKVLALHESFRHAIFHEKDRQLPTAQTRDFIREVFCHEGELDSTEAETAAPRSPTPTVARPPALRRLGFGVLRLLLRTVGRLSRGIRLGWREGFDSGATLDYVYENRACGWTPAGRWIDRLYLDSVGWKGIRERRRVLTELLTATLEETAREAGATRRRVPVRLLDIACGRGRYVLEALAAAKGSTAEATLCDIDPANVETVRERARELGLDGVQCIQGDAFDEELLSGLSPKAMVAVVSGLYELFPDDDRVSRSLRGVAVALEAGGLLVYTNQPWHPQLDLIAHTLTNRDGQPWRMRCRPQRELDDLVRAAGFEKLATRVTEGGIFTVSVARRG